MNFNQAYITPNQEVHLPILKEKSITLFIKREDQIHPFVSGNKFRKLKYNIQKAKQQKAKTVVTFGGAFSNHIIATAVAANLNGLQSIGIVRGDELGRDLKKTLSENTTLQVADKNGMTLFFISRSEYQNKYHLDFINQLKEKFGDFYLIPEGGSNSLAVKGCEEILTKDDAKFDYICSSVGTGGTISGLINSIENHQKVIGFPALKGNFLSAEIQQYVKKDTWSLVTKYHFGGYAKHTEELIRFINNFTTATKIPLDPIYTGKMLFGLLDMIEKDVFKKGTKILAIHTGGLQGIAGFNMKLKKKNQQIIKHL